MAENSRTSIATSSSRDTPVGVLLHEFVEDPDHAPGPHLEDKGVPRLDHDPFDRRRLGWQTRIRERGPDRHMHPGHGSGRRRLDRQVGVAAGEHEHSEDQYGTAQASQDEHQKFTSTERGILWLKT